MNVGRDNFDEIRFEYFRDSTVALEAFKGDQIDWRTENSAKNWATAYDFPAVRDKRVILEEFPITQSGVMQAFVFNTRRDKFKDPRVRRAFNFAFDFEEMNKQIFFGQYKRIDSYFEGTELAARGLPEGQELEILETVRDKVPPEVFTTPYTQSGRRHAGGGARQSARGVAAAARGRLGDPQPPAGQRQDQRADDGRVPAVEPGFGALRRCSTSRRWSGSASPSPCASSTTRNTRTGCASGTTTSSPRCWGQSLSPGNEQRGFWGSQAADQPGSRNFAGIKNPAIDALIDRVIFAKDRDELVAATKALDRVLLWNHYVVPQWTYGKMRTARWDRFGRPDPLPKYGVSGFPTIWWWDKDKAAKTGSAFVMQPLAPRRPDRRRGRRGAPRASGLHAAAQARRPTPSATACRPSAT